MDDEAGQRRLVGILEAAAAAPAGERSALIDRLPDPALRREARRLLDSAETADSWEDLATDFARRFGPQGEADDDAPPAAPGGYELVRRLGRGAAGEVWEARQIEPVRRAVALKFLRPRWADDPDDSGGVLRRFEAERQALARLDHPGVARVLDAGRSPEGRPFVAMSLVDGRPVTRHAEARNLDVEQRLRLVADACAAVQHAHGRGLIHRDLKPANLLAGDGDDGSPRVVVIDFGIAKALAEAEADLTLQGQRFGTPAYMAPEQWRDAADADVRADVWALGVILYELLCGERPFDGLAAPVVEPPPPSSRRPGLPRELDWICGKALRIDRDRRYESAAALAQDIDRHLTGRPLRAGPETRRYRAGKFLARNKLAASLAAAAAVAIAGGASAAAWQAVRATSAERRATAARVEAEQRADEAELARRQSEASRDFFTGLLAAAAPEQARGRDVTVSELADRAAAAVDGPEAPAEPMVEAEVRDALTTVLHGLGRWPEAAAQAERVAAIAAGEYGPRHVETLHARATLAAMVMLAGDLGRAADLHAEALADAEPFEGDPAFDEVLMGLRNNYASLLKRQGDYARAEAVQRDVIAQAGRVFGPDDPTTLTVLNNHASTLRWLRRHDEAERGFEAALAGRRRALGDDHPHTLQTMANLASLAQTTGDHATAESLGREVLARRTSMLGADHPDTLLSLSGLAMTLQAAGRAAEAAAMFADCHARRLARLGPDHADTLKSAADWGDALVEAGDVEAGLSRMRAAVGDLAEHAAGSPNHLHNAARLGRRLEGAGRDAEAESVLLPLAEADAGKPLDPHTAEIAYAHLAAICEKRGDAAGAAAWQARRRAAMGRH